VNVAWVEQNQVARAIVEEDDLNCGSRPAPQHWGLRRVSAPDNRGSSILEYSTSQGAGVDVYIIDTGILTEHNDFGGRASFGFDCTGEGPGDRNGHGTHCAGTAAGTTHGIASQSNLFAVKVLNGGGSGTFACVIAGIDWVGARSGPRVGSLSLGGGFSAAVNTAVDGAVGRGAAMSSASGNSNANACNFSPASAADGVCVNSIQDGDQRSSFSNFGTCSDIFAPGTNILSAWIGSNSATRSISGTSMACPHVTGVIAETWSANPSMTGAEAQTAVLAAGVRDKVSNAGSGSPNVLAQTSCA
jgi:subtilisin family serine protease